jgi:hypothetical protein
VDRRPGNPPATGVQHGSNFSHRPGSAASSSWTAAAAALVSCASVAPESAESVLRRADSAMGGKDLKSISFAGSGTGATFGQAYEPGGAWPKITYSSFTRLADYDQGAFREDAARSRAEPAGGGRGAADGHRASSAPPD